MRVHMYESAARAFDFAVIGDDDGLNPVGLDADFESEFMDSFAEFDELDCTVLHSPHTHTHTHTHTRKSAKAPAASPLRVAEGGKGV